MLKWGFDLKHRIALTFFFNLTPLLSLHFILSPGFLFAVKLVQV